MAEHNNDKHDDESRARIERARLARIFGDVLPETTGDERTGSEDTRSDEWFDRERPPHHY
ncbi:hypothetical protein BJD99_11825 [Rhodococcus sp. 1163]|uniref:hypothetical protein n=1 Tax=unclassified Rhodococcus (in: high G+C Gram-positive bacteria) TaxID=192944 RepID=UPI0009FE6530|nr:hypothetical protein [Rhodococcus sp. 1163]ORI13816.1 hypothetical protein BJD99_11825 [Rhodococcus sp. 1163]